jgi:hypothetical protein
MTEAQAIAAHLNETLPRGGSLCVWGQWFGRPLDNVHQIVSCEADNDLLKVHFEKGETLFVWSPSGSEARKHAFQIARATKVRWQWFTGARRSASDRGYWEFKKEGDAIVASTNVRRSTPLRGRVEAPSIEIA